MHPSKMCEEVLLSEYELRKYIKEKFNFIKIKEDTTVYLTPEGKEARDNICSFWDKIVERWKRDAQIYSEFKSSIRGSLKKE